MQLLDHLNANCGGLHPSELVSLPTEMMGYYALADGIPEYINMLEEAQRKLARANLPMSDDQLQLSSHPNTSHAQQTSGKRSHAT